jgi:hypothetical protein
MVVVSVRASVFFPAATPPVRGTPHADLDTTRYQTWSLGDTWGDGMVEVRGKAIVMNSE